MSTQKPDIVKRLRDGVYGLNRLNGIELCNEAADEIEVLRKIIESMDAELDIIYRQLAFFYD